MYVYIYIYIYSSSIISFYHVILYYKCATQGLSRRGATVCPWVVGAPPLHKGEVPNVAFTSSKSQDSGLTQT